jgi:putative ABC transport system permease protein
LDWHPDGQETQIVFLSLREVRHAKLRFALITLVIVMVSALVFIIAGLANGLSEGTTAAIKALPGDAMVISAGSDSLLDRSVVSAAEAETIAGIVGIEQSEPIGISSANIKTEGSAHLVGVSLFGVVPDGFVQPHITSGTWLDGSDNGVVVDESLSDDGIGLGDSVTVEPGGAKLNVIGITKNQTYRISPVIFLPLPVWQQLQPEQERRPADGVTAILVNGSDQSLSAIPDTVPDVTVASKQEISDHIPGESEQNSTLFLIQIFLVIIAAGIIAAFFYIITLQKMPELGVMKAIGASTGYLARALVSQVVGLALAGVLIGISIADTLAIVIGNAVPYSISVNRMALFGSLLLLVAVGGTALSLLRIARVDPLDAINTAG